MCWNFYISEAKSPAASNSCWTGHMSGNILHSTTSSFNINIIYQPCLKGTEIFFPFSWMCRHLKKHKSLHANSQCQCRGLWSDGGSSLAAENRKMRNINITDKQSWQGDNLIPAVCYFIKEHWRYSLEFWPQFTWSILKNTKRIKY